MKIKNTKFANLLDIPLVYSLWQAPFYKQKVYHLVNDLKTVNHPLRVLDLGCGPGTNIEFFKDHHYTGVDLNPNYIKSIKHAADRILICSDVNSFLEQDSGKYDIILINSLMHHLDTNEVTQLLGKLSDKLNHDANVYIFDLVLPLNAGVPRLLTSLDRGNYPRDFNVWVGLFNNFLMAVRIEKYYLKLGPFKFWEMIYFKGSKK